jgi:catechol 2,3-dioxygenase-like lactoylglutathione lyase family enzyme
MTPKVHIALNVKNLQESLAFYRALWGVEPVKLRTGYAKFDIAEPAVNLTLNENPVNGLGALNHLGIQVGSSEAVLAMRERLQARGLLTKDEMQTNCCYAIQDKIWMTDPNGYQWEVFVVIQDQLPETTMCCDTSAATAPAVVSIGGMKHETSNCAVKAI